MFIKPLYVVICMAPLERAGKLGASDKGGEQGGCGCLDLGPDLLVSVTVVHAVRIREWVMTPCIVSVLVGFHYRVARRLTGNQPRQGRDGI